MTLLKQFKRKDYYIDSRGEIAFRIHQKPPFEFAHYCQQIIKSRKKGQTQDIGDKILDYFKRNNGFDNQEDLDIALDYFDTDFEISLFCSGYILSNFNNPYQIKKSKKRINPLNYFNMAFNLASRAKQDLNSALEISDDPDEINYFSNSKRAVEYTQRKIYLHAEFPKNAKRILNLEESLNRAITQKDFLTANLINEELDSLTLFRVK